MASKSGWSILGNKEAVEYNQPLSGDVLNSLKQFQG
jgi:hypothetical protein